MSKQPSKQPPTTTQAILPNGISASGFPVAGFFRRISSWVYDLLISVAVYMIAGAVSFFLISLALNYGLIGMGGFTHVSDRISETPWLLALNELWKMYWLGFFFIYFWTKSGQTIGMKAWRLRVQNQDGSLMNKPTAIRRLFVTFLGLGNFLVIFDRNKLALQDRLTQTEVVVLSLEANRGRL